MMECPNCKMSIKGSSTFCIHCGAQLGGMAAQGNVGPMPNQGVGVTPPQNNGMRPPVPPIQGSVSQPNTPAVAQNNPQPTTQESAPSTYRGKILVTLPALGILIVYSYMIFTLTVLIYTMIKLFSTPLYTQYVHKSIFASKEFLMMIGVDLVLAVSFILTVLHKKYMGFAAILYSVGFIIYDLVKLDKAVMPIVASVFVIFCAIFYLSEEDPV